MSGKPRNRVAAERGRAIRTALRAAIDKLICPHCHALPSAKRLVAELPPELRRARGTIQHHLRVIRAEHE